MQAYLTPLPEVRVICVDELGPLAVKTYPGAEWQLGQERATFEPDYGRRGVVWVHGAFEPATGAATIVITPKRDSDGHIQLLEQMISSFPAQRWLVIEDNLSIHTSRATRLALMAWPEIQLQFTPKYAPWLNLIEPWWKQLRSLALNGRCFQSVEDLTLTLQAALAYWNDHRYPYRWKKLPQQQPALPFLGGFAVERPLSLVI